MGDSLAGIIAKARSGADELADPLVEENHAIKRWMRHHWSFSFGKKHYIVGTTPLPERWRKLCRQFHFNSDAETFLKTMIGDPMARHGMRQAVMEVSQTCMEDANIVPVLAGFLVTRRAWLLDAATPEPSIGKTDPAVYVKVNADLGTNIDFAFVAGLEGDQWLHGYVPFANTGRVDRNSGLTIATGFDVGRHDATELRRMGLSNDLLKQLTPFAAPLSIRGLTREQVLKKFHAMNAAVPIISKADADAIDAASHRVIARRMRDVFNARKAAGVVKFEALPSNWQAVLFSRAFQEGPGVGDKADPPGFFKAAYAGDWAKAIQERRAYAADPVRTQKEANLLATSLPPPPAKPAAAASGVPPRPGQLPPRP